jgi:hypothetical protein
MRALSTVLAKPGIVRVKADGECIRGERWLLSPAALAVLIDGLFEPMVLGRVRLNDGTTVIGFLFEPIAAEMGDNISERGDWRTYLAETAKPRDSCRSKPLVPATTSHRRRYRSAGSSSVYREGIMIEISPRRQSP